MIAPSNPTTEASRVPLFDEGGVQIVLRARVLLLDQYLRGFARLAERRIHQHHVVSFVAEVHEGKPPHGVVGEEPPLKPLAVLGLLGVVTQSFDYLALGLLEELVVGDVGEIEELLFCRERSIAACVNEQAGLSIRGLGRLSNPLLLASATASRISSSILRSDPASPASFILSKTTSTTWPSSFGSSWPTNSLSICSSPGIGSAQTKFERVILGRSFFSPIS